MSVCLCLAKSWSVGSKPSHLSQSLYGNVFICWNKTPRIDMLCWIKTAPASVVLCNFLSAAMRACSCSFVIMAASATHNLKFCISEFRSVATPALPLLELSSQPVALKSNFLLASGPCRLPPAVPALRPLLSLPLGGVANVDGESPLLRDILADSCLEPPLASRMP